MPDEETNIEDQIVSNAVAPKSAEVDGQKVEQHSIDDQIKAVQFAATMKAVRSGSCGIRFCKMQAGDAQ